MLVWIDLIKEISAEPSLVPKLLLVEEIWAVAWAQLQQYLYNCNGAVNVDIFPNTRLGKTGLAPVGPS